MLEYTCSHLLETFIMAVSYVPVEASTQALNLHRVSKYLLLTRLCWSNGHSVGDISGKTVSFTESNICDFHSHSGTENFDMLSRTEIYMDKNNSSNLFQQIPAHLMCGVVIRFVFHVLQLLLIRFTQHNLCCISNSMMKHQQKLDWK